MIDRTDLLKQSRDRKWEVDRVPLVLTYSSLLPNIHDIVVKHMHVLYQSERMERVLGSPPLEVAYRRNKKLCDMLVHRETNRIVTRHSDTMSCDKGCIYCAGILKSVIWDTSGQVTYQTKAQVNCCLQNVVYHSL